MGFKSLICFFRKHNFEGIGNWSSCTFCGISREYYERKKGRYKKIFCFFGIHNWDNNGYSKYCSTCSKHVQVKCIYLSGTFFSRKCQLYNNDKPLDSETVDTYCTSNSNECPSLRHKLVKMKLKDEMEGRG